MKALAEEMWRMRWELRQLRYKLERAESSFERHIVSRDK